HPKSHCNLAKDFLAQYTNDSDLLEITQNHDLNYDLWKQYKKTGSYDKDALIQLLQKIQDINLFLVFTIIDGNTPGKYLDKLPWFINEVKKYRNDVRIDNTWIKPLPTNMPEISL
ncbi:MAG: hypothetical protein Q8880_11545, partial [Bacteroidota bacterium]|nr:hypothetical protein [Bacteroidota bacterium]